MPGRLFELLLFGLAPLLIGAALIPLRSVASEMTVDGELHYRERIALPENAVAKIQVLDVTHADAQARLVAEQVVDPAGQVPIPFGLVLDRTELEVGRTYVLEAHIAVGDRMWYVTADRYAFDPSAQAAKIILKLRAVQNSVVPLAPAGASTQGPNPKAGVEA